MESKVLGQKGEEAACIFLKKKGYRIRDRNFRCRLGEIDIVAEDHGEIVFVEVKTRQSLDFGSPEESLDYFKKKRLTRLALFYLSIRNLQNFPSRFDVVSIKMDGEKIEDIQIIKNAFEATF